MSGEPILHSTIKADLQWKFWNWEENLRPDGHTRIHNNYLVIGHGRRYQVHTKVIAIIGHTADFANDGMEKLLKKCLNKN